MWFRNDRRHERRGRPRPGPGRTASPERLEHRDLPSAASPHVTVLAASTADSREVMVAYRVDGAPLTRPIAFGVYRSSDPVFDAGDRYVGGAAVQPTGSPLATNGLDGEPAGAVGVHRLTVALPGGLPPNPARSYVLVVADPSRASGLTGPADDTAGFRKHILGIVVHGGIQNAKQTPLWELKLGRMLRAAGYDKVIPYNWSAESNTAGAAAKQGPRVANLARKASEAFPADEPVDLHLIGHSEGAVVVSQALRALGRRSTPQLRQGYLRVTLLDPHAANNHAGGGQMSVPPGLVGGFARWVTQNFQAKAHDPPVVIPDSVNAAEVYFQHTPVAWNHANHGEYNLWGQVPVRGHAQYSDLTGPGITHGGGQGVQVWYALNVVPTLRDGDGTFVNPTRLDGMRVGPDAYAGTAAPGVPVTLVAERAGDHALKTLGRAVADAAGHWAVDAATLAPGRYRIVARGVVPEGLPSPRKHLFPRVPVATVAVPPGSARA